MEEFPTLPEVTGEVIESDPGPAVVALGDERADDLFPALASPTARQLLQQLREAPTYPFELAEATDTSIQKVHYHLGNLAEAGALNESGYRPVGRVGAVRPRLRPPPALASRGVLA